MFLTSGRKVPPLHACSVLAKLKNLNSECKQSNKSSGKCFVTHLYVKPVLARLQIAYLIIIIVTISQAVVNCRIHFEVNELFRIYRMRSVTSFSITRDIMFAGFCCCLEFQCCFYVEHFLNKDVLYVAWSIIEAFPHF